MRRQIAVALLVAVSLLTPSAFAASVGTQSTRNQPVTVETATYDPTATATINALSLATTSVMATSRRHATNPVTCVMTKRSTVRVFYTPETRDLLGGESAVQIWTSAAFSALNETIANTRRGNNRVDLVKLVPVSHHDAVLTNGWLSDDQDWASSSSEALALDEQYPATETFLLVAASKGQIIGAPSSGHPGVATVVAVPAGVDAFVHMWGHGYGRNMGHQTGFWTNPDPVYATDRAIDGLFSGIMSNPADSCPHGCPWVRVFATPAVNFDGIPTGIANISENGRTLDKFFEDKDVVCVAPTLTTIN